MVLQCLLIVGSCIGMICIVLMNYQQRAGETTVGTLRGASGRSLLEDCDEEYDQFVTCIDDPATEMPDLSYENTTLHNCSVVGESWRQCELAKVRSSWIRITTHITKVLFVQCPLFI